MIGSEGGDFPAREAAFCVATEIRKNNYKQKIEKGLQTENNVTHQRFPFCGTTEVHFEVDPPPSKYLVFGRGASVSSGCVRRRAAGEVVQ